jgi:hypothetical protein
VNKEYHRDSNFNDYHYDDDDDDDDDDEDEDNDNYDDDDNYEFMMMTPVVTFQLSQKHDLTYINKHMHQIILTFIHLDCKTFQHSHAPDNSDVEGGQGKGEFVHHIT